MLQELSKCEEPIKVFELYSTQIEVVDSSDQELIDTEWVKSI